MRYSASEKHEIIRTVEESPLGITRTIRQLGIPRSTFYNWYDRYLSGGIEALEDKKPEPRAIWNKVPDGMRKKLLDMALDEPELSPRELAVRFTSERNYFLSEATAYRILKEHDLVTSPAWIVMKAADKFNQPTTAINQLWQTDFTYLKVTGWGWYYLSTVMDDYSRYIIAWRLCTGMAASDVSATLKDALHNAGLSRKQRPKLLSDNGPCYVSAELRGWLEDHGMSHTRGKPYHPMTQGKIERWHQSLKNCILLENYYLPEDLERRIEAFVTYYNTRRYHESLNNLTPEDVWLGRGQSFLEQRRKIKEKTLKLRKKLYFKSKAA
jgi:transposase InsO family protein